MKRWFVLAITFVLAAALLAGCACEHEWRDADCKAPKTCSLCGETEGQAKEHTWKDANCDTPKTCTECGATDGAPLGHSWLAANCETAKTCEICGTVSGEALGHSWQDATCANPKTCASCNKTEGEALSHSWQEATTEAPKTCATCNATEGERIITDERFSTAASKEVFGTWSGTLLFDGENELGIVIVGENLDFEASYTYTFYNDGTVNLVCIVDEEGFFRVMKIATIEQLYVTFEQQNLTRKEADAQFLSYYGMTIEEYVDATIAQMSIEDFMDNNMEGVYYVDNGFIYMSEEWDEEMTAYAYTLDGDTMTLVDGNSDVLILTKQS